VSDGM